MSFEFFLGGGGGWVYSEGLVFGILRYCWQLCKMFFCYDLFISNSGSFCIFLYFYYKNKIFLTQLVKKLIINKEHNHLNDNNRHN